MAIAIVFILLLATLGGGIYLWVRWQRSKMLKRAVDLARTSAPREPAGSILPDIPGPEPSSTLRPSANWPRPSGLDSTADHPEISPPPDTTIGDKQEAASGDGKGENDPAQSSQTPTPEPVDSKYAASFRLAAPKINDLSEKLLAAWSEASDAKYAAEKADKDRRYASYDLQSFSLKDLSTGGKLHTHIDHGGQLHAAAISAKLKWYELSARVLPQAQAAGKAFEALRLALKPFEKQYCHLLPADLKVLCLAAHNAMDVSKPSIESLLKDAQETVKEIEKAEQAGRPLKRSVMESLFEGDRDEKTFADGTHGDDQNDTLEARAQLKQAVVDSLERYLQMREGLGAVANIFSHLASLEDRHFTYPQKPTPEEILRFLTELEDWSKEKLDAERSVAPLLSEARRRIKEVGDAVKAVKRARGRTAPIISDAHRMVDEGLLMATATVVDALESLVGSANEELSKSAAQQPTVKDSQPSATGDEQAHIKTLRESLRTIAFALAQSAVASTKLSQVRRQEPSTHCSAPHIDRNAGFGRYLSQYKAFDDRQKQQLEDHSKWEQGKEVIKMAFEARKAKVAETSKALSSKLAEAQKVSPSKTAEELLVVEGVVKKIVQLTGI